MKDEILAHLHDIQIIGKPMGRYSVKPRKGSYADVRAKDENDKQNFKTDDNQGP